MKDQPQGGASSVTMGYDAERGSKESDMCRWAADEGHRGWAGKRPVQRWSSMVGNGGEGFAGADAKSLISMGEQGRDDQRSMTESREGQNLILIR